MRAFLTIAVTAALCAACSGYAAIQWTFVEPSDAITEPVSHRNTDEKLHMLALVNDARASAGAFPVTMGDNSAAQIQADQLLEDCVTSHWGDDGLKPYMRYTLAGGYQGNREIVFGRNECGLTDGLFQRNDEPAKLVADAVEAWLKNPRHRKTMLDPGYRKVNIGLAWGRSGFKAVQHFEGDYVKYGTLPVITGGTLELEGILKKKYRFKEAGSMYALVSYDPPPEERSGQQTDKTRCYGLGKVIGAFTQNRRLTGDRYEHLGYTGEGDCEVPGNGQQAEAEETATVRTYEKMRGKGAHFYLTADISDLLDRYGPGVYTVVLVAKLEGEPGGREAMVISEYSIFHEVEAPRTYGQERRIF